MTEGIEFTATPDEERLTNLLSSPVAMADGGTTGADLLWFRYWSSPYGEFMDKQPYRFAQHFGYEENLMIADLGIDVLPRDHQMETGLFVCWILDKEFEESGTYPIMLDDIGIVLFAAFIHDSGESLHPEIAEEVGAVVGDIPYGHKTDEDRRVEAAVRRALYSRLYPDVDTGILERVEGIISHKDTTSLHDLFEAAHSLQAFVTSMRAKSAHIKALSGEITRDLDTIVKLDQLHRTVAKNMAPHVKEWAKRLKFAAHIIELYSEVFEQS